MNDAPLVRSRESAGHLQRIVDRFARGKRSGMDTLA